MQTCITEDNVMTNKLQDWFKKCEDCKYEYRDVLDEPCSQCIDSGARAYWERDEAMHTYWERDEVAPSSPEK
jgi:hypothetical protein